MREEPRKQNPPSNTSFDVNIKGVPRMERVGALKPNDVFFTKRCSAARVVVGENCYSKTLIEKYEKQDGKKLTLYYDLSMKHIGTIPADEWVMIANKMKVEVS